MTNEQLVEVKSGSRVESFPLGDVVAFEIFELLNFTDCMSLAEAFKGLEPVSCRFFKRKFNKLTIESSVGLDRILRHIGSSLKSLSIYLDEDSLTESDVMQIGDECKDLRCLYIYGYDKKKFESNPFANFLNNKKLEELTFSNSCFDSDIDFFNAFHNLKTVNFKKCNIHTHTVSSCFANNPDICSFTCNDQYFMVPRLLLMLKNLERLSLLYDSQLMKLDVLGQLQSLRCLTLLCHKKIVNVNNVLADLVKVNRLEQLVLVNIEIDEGTFALLKSLERLKFLGINSNNSERLLSASVELPTNLKTLRLAEFRITNGFIASTLKKLKQIENLNFENCEVEYNGIWLDGFDWMAHLMIKHFSGIHRQLNVAISTCDYSYPAVSKPKI